MLGKNKLQIGSAPPRPLCVELRRQRPGHGATPGQMFCFCQAGVCPLWANKIYTIKHSLGAPIVNFVDLLLENIALVSASEVIDTALDKWGSTRHGIDEENSLKYPQFINDLLHIADLDTSANFEGLVAFVCCCDKLGFANTIKAFRRIGDKRDADILEEIFHIPEVQGLYAGGRKALPDEVVERIIILGTEMYFHKPKAEMWDLLEDYLAKEMYNYTSHTKYGLKN
jgi:hypothetical protein